MKPCRGFIKSLLNFEKRDAIVLVDGITKWVFSGEAIEQTEQWPYIITVNFLRQLKHFISNSLSLSLPMFYIFVVVVEHLTQLWPLLLFAFISIAVCHLVAKYTNINGSTIITATLTAAHNGSTIYNRKLGKKPIIEQCNAPEKSLYFEFIHPSITVINTSVIGEYHKLFMLDIKLQNTKYIFY